MSYDYMLPVYINNYETERLHPHGYEYTSTITSGPGNWVILPTEVSNATVTVSFGSGTAKVQHTTSTLADVMADSAVAVDWPSGEVTATTSDIVFPVTAIRLNVTSAGSVTIEVRAQ